jgi:hypothetical protein
VFYDGIHVTDRGSEIYANHIAQELSGYIKWRPSPSIEPWSNSISIPLRTSSAGSVDSFFQLSARSQTIFFEVPIKVFFALIRPFSPCPVRRASCRDFFVKSKFLTVTVRLLGFYSWVNEAQSSSLKR